MICTAIDKKSLRETWLNTRSAVPKLRRESAAAAFTERFVAKTAPCKAVLSYASFNGELSTEKLNSLLAGRGQLILPRVNGKTLSLYQVDCPSEQLEKNSWGIYEPIPSLCPPVSLETVDFIIAPALAFDEVGTRLGYGGGFYDRLLSSVFQTVPTVGVGFTEQSSHQRLPSFTHDISLSAIELF